MYELRPVYSSQKSFSGKAKYTSNMHDGNVLYSYGTKVASIQNAQLVRHWGGYSATTLRHVNEFARQNGLDNIGKAQWDKMHVVR